MSAETGWLLIAAGAGPVVVGMAMVGVAAPRAKRRRGRAVRPAAGLSGALTCTSVVCGVIAGVQWAILSQTGPGAAWAVVLWLPAFLAGATVTRLLAVLRIVCCRRRQVQAAARRERRTSR